MNIEEFILNLEEEFDDIEAGSVKADSKFREIFEWSSINALILIAMVKTEYDVAINADDIRKSQTVEDIFNIVKERAAS